MRLTTLMEILESEIGASSSARSELARMVAERSNKDAAASATGAARNGHAQGGQRGAHSARNKP